MLKLTIFSFLMAVIPALFLVWFYCRPAGMALGARALVIKIFLIGVLSIVPICTLEIIISKLNQYYNWSRLIYYFFEAFIVAGLCEEYIKLAIIKIFVYNNPRFQRIVDGIIYTIIASLGFACIENILYVFPNNWETAIVRGLTAVPLHAVASGTMGYYIGLAKFSLDKKEESRLINIGLWQAIFIHGLYNFLILISPLFGSLYAAFIIPLLIYIYFKLKAKIHLAVELDQSARS